MARIPRGLSVKAGFSVHKVWRGHNKEWNLETANQKARYLEYMNEDLESDRYEAGSFPEAITLMSNHGHEMSGVTHARRFSDHMRRHHSRYGRYFNDLKERCGKVAQDRPHTTLIGDDHHRMTCTFYIHANPHRAGMSDAERYEFSTHKLYAYGKVSAWMRNIQMPDWYHRLGKCAAERQRRYRKLFAHYLKTFGMFKQSFLSKRFYGPADWTIKHEEQITEWRKTRGPAPPS